MMKKMLSMEDRTMKRYMTYLAMAVIAMTFSCAKETPEVVNDSEKTENSVQGRKITLTFNLDEDTKISHALDGTTIKPTWEEGDCIKLVHSETIEYFYLDAESIGQKSGTFTCDASTLADGEAYTVTYYKNNCSVASKDMDWETNYASNANWSVQDGTLDHLPEYLSGSATYPAAATLNSNIFYFHFDFTSVANSGIGRTFSSATLSCIPNDNNFRMLNGHGTYGDITINAVDNDHLFTVNADGTTENMDFYVALNTISPNAADARTFSLTFNSADAVADLAVYNLSWRQMKAYNRGKIYKPSGTLSNTNYSVPQGKRLTVTFDCSTTAAEPQLYNYWRLLMGDWCDLRCDYWNNITGRDYMYTPGIDWGNFHTIMNGGQTVMTIDNSSNGYVFVQTTTTKEASSISYTYAHASSADIVATLVGDQATITPVSSTISDIPASEDVKSVTAAHTAYYEGIPGYITLYTANAPYLVDVVATYDDDHTEGIDYSLNQYTLNIPTATVAYNAESIGTYAFRGDGAITGNTVFTPSGRQTSVLGGTTSIGSKTDGFTVHNGYQWTVAPGTSQTVGFTVDSDAAANWHGPIVELWNSAWNVCYGDARWDNYSWGDGFAGAVLESNWNWDIFAANINTCKVYVTVTNTGTGLASIRYYVVYEDSSTHYQYFDNIAVAASESFKFAFATENCSLNFTE